MRPIVLGLILLFGLAGAAWAEGDGYDCLEDLVKDPVVSDGTTPQPAPAPGKPA